MSEELLKRLVDVVHDHYLDSDAPPLLMSRIGQTHKVLLDDLKAKYGTLMAAVKAAGSDRLRIVDHRLGRQSIAPTEMAPSIELKIEQDSATQKASSSNFDSLPKPVQIAFCLRTQAGEHVTVRVAPPFAYQKVPALDFVRPGFRHLPDEYRKPRYLAKGCHTAGPRGSLAIIHRLDGEGGS